MAAERQHVDTFTPYAPNDTPTTDADGFEVPGFDIKTPTAGKIQAGSRAGSDTATRYVTIGGVPRPVVEGGLHIPIDAEVPVASEQRGVAWEYECTGVGSDSDPAGLGKRWMVVSVPAKTRATARRLDVVEV